MEHIKYKRNSALYIKLQIYKWNILYPFKKVPQPTTKKKNESPTTKVLPSFSTIPTIDTKKKSISSEFWQFLHLYLELGKTWRACLHFSGHWHQSLFWQKLKERGKSKNYGIWLWLQFEPREQLNLWGLKRIYKVWGQAAYNEFPMGPWKNITFFLRSMKVDCFQAWQC